MSDRVRKCFRLSSEVAHQLEEIASKLSSTETEALARAISYYYLTLKGEEDTFIKGGLVPLSEYQSLQEQIGKLLYRLGELEGGMKEKEEVLKANQELLKAKEELIQELRKRLEEKRKRWWKLWE